MLEETSRLHLFKIPAVCIAVLISTVLWLTPLAFAAPNQLDVVDMQGNGHSMSKLLSEGKTVGLVFWQSWCAQCKRELPKLAEVARANSNKLSLFGIISGEDSDIDEQKVRRVVDKFQLPYPQVRDRSLALAKQYDIKGTPTIILLGADESVLYRGNTPPKDWQKYLKSNQRSENKLILREQSLAVMGTDLTVKALGEDSEQLDRAIAAAVKEMQRIDDLMTDWRESELTRLNAAAGKGAHVVPMELAAIVARGIEMSRVTKGAFDITYASVGQLWDFKKKPPVIPQAEAIQKALKFVGANRITVNPKKNSVELPSGMSIGLGGIAKGYGVDRAMAVLIKHGIEHASVNAGGDMKLLGTKFGKPWEVAVKHPRNRKHALAVLNLSNTCVVSSGDYERYFKVNGKRYHHIIDPRSGYPAEGTLSTTVVAQNAEFADALATGISILGAEKGIQLVESLKRVEAIVVDKDGKVHASSGLQTSLRPLVTEQLNR